MPEYGSLEYWDERYTNLTENKDFDWYHGYPTLKEFLNKFFKKKDKILMLGCGNSKLGEDMNDDEFIDIINMDYSEPLIEYMKERTKGRVGLEYLTIDGRDMKPFFKDNEFDHVFDKGTLDAVMCSDDDNENAKKILLEVSRIIKPGGFFIVMTYGSPESRLPLLNNPIHNWTTSLRMAGSNENSQMNQCHYIYICNKNSENGQSMKHTFPMESHSHFLNSSIGEVPLEILKIKI
ncbi:hypothetical protein ACTFIU_007086 [Dictyostelium citrinum]